MTALYCPYCDDTSWSRLEYGQYTERHRINTEVHPTGLQDDWDNINQDLDNSDPWECWSDHQAPDEIATYLNNDERPDHWPPRQPANGPLGTAPLTDADYRTLLQLIEAHSPNREFSLAASQLLMNTPLTPQPSPPPEPPTQPSLHTTWPTP